jgi:hypothetical protein
MESIRPRLLRLVSCFLACVLVATSGTAYAGKKCDDIITEYVLAITRISTNVSDPQERSILQKDALKELIKNARSIYGPFCPCDEFLNRADAFQEHRENWRSPPPGWEPGKFRADFLPLEVEIAHEDIRLLMHLMRLCKMY